MPWHFHRGIYVPMHVLPVLRRSDETDYLCRVTTPIVARSHKNVPELVGTGIYLEVGGQHFMVTAAHVIQSLAGATPHVSSARPESMTISLAREETLAVTLSEEIADDPIDMAVTTISGETLDTLGDVTFVSLRGVDVQDDTAPQAIYRIAGYPRSRVKPNARVKEFYNEFYSMGVGLCPDDRSVPNWNADCHVLLDFDRDDFADQAGTRQRAPYPRGMSGCGVWRSRVGDAAPEMEDLKLVAIATHYYEREKVVRCTRIGYVLIGVAAMCPEVEDTVREAGVEP